MNAKNVIKMVRDQFGAAFPFVADSVKLALIESVILQIVQQQDSEHMEKQSAAWLQSKIEGLRSAAMAEFGI
jgi:high-affinity Fe2+/Pb2+ permease